jgi:4-diphosphocytidyl-2-C-methyl-D-erythritol kinase
VTLLALYDVPAPAKLNLFLHVVGRRPDGYHLLQSLFVFIDWADTLHFERRGDGRLARHDLGPPLPADDLCLRAARALQEAGGCTLGADISVTKQVPSGAGMGGGSSDTATTLLALNRLWGLHLPRARLGEIGLRLGADVPFFVAGRNAFVEGIGERLRPVTLPPAAYTVVKPQATLATRDVFEHPALVRDTAPVIVAGSFEDGLPAEWTQGFGRNDLQTAAEACCPEVAQAAGWLQARYGNSRMTGSGSAVFARAGTSEPPLAFFSEADLPRGWVGRMCRSLAVHPLAGWAD